MTAALVQTQTNKTSSPSDIIPSTVHLQPLHFSSPLTTLAHISLPLSQTHTHTHTYNPATMQHEAAMHANDGFKVFINKMIRRNRKEAKRGMEISAPFNFQKCNLDIAGISADEIAMLKEQAVASRIGIADFDSDYPARPLFSIQPVMSSASISTLRSSYSS
ncbi:hypothetical protein CTA2_8195 [Colletotrichum tanaceti]|uniref:Uncharacterized protein n=1 Tax=Colletotrichum tanaceti TaxID=1306861 RepID=A0A4U6XNE8_9PEZI|nr:hypothetical protein CTA2_8195 [Colletotrichum tanaceti]TKW57275.1 hypothetical protein CTA1_2218 [Colletotrichum tanaceti]